MLDELRAIRAAVDELRAEVAPDLHTRIAVLRAIRARFGDVIFTAADLVEVVELQTVLAPLAGSPASVRRLSRRLSKLKGRPGNGLVLHKVGDVAPGAVFVVKQA